jgi:regulation of enolase protein 1 (concanavalin A-like superfamily)
MAPTQPMLPELTWLGQRGDAAVAGDRITLSAGPGTDWFHDPDGTGRLTSAPVLRFAAVEDCQVSAQVTVEFESTFDAGVMFVHQRNHDYAKLCFERSPQGDNTMVSVVTRGVSDDANGPAVEGNTVWVRVSKYRDAIAFHWSSNAQTWHLLRFFQLRTPGLTTSIGFSTQSPTGPGCAATFSNIRYTPGAPNNIRDGS